MLPAVPPWLERFTKALNPFLSSIRNVNDTHRLLTASAGSIQNSRVIFDSFTYTGLTPSPDRFYKGMKDLLSLSSSNVIMNSIVKKLYAKKVLKVKETFNFPHLLQHLILFQMHLLRIQVNDPSHHYLTNQAELRQAF